MRHDCSADLVGHRAYRLERLGVLERGGRRLVHAVEMEMEMGKERQSLRLMLTEVGCRSA